MSNNEFPKMNQDITQGIFAKKEVLFMSQHPKGFNNPDVEVLKKNLKEFYEPFFKGNRVKLRITNAYNAAKETESVYTATINAQEIIFQLSSSLKKQTWKFIFGTGALTLNDLSQTDDRFIQFLSFLKKMSSEIASNKAEVIEELS